MNSSGRHRGFDKDNPPTLAMRSCVRFSRRPDPLSMQRGRATWGSVPNKRWTRWYGRLDSRSSIIIPSNGSMRRTFGGAPMDSSGYAGAYRLRLHLILSETPIVFLIDDQMCSFGSHLVGREATLRRMIPRARAMRSRGELVWVRRRTADRAYPTKNTECSRQISRPHRLPRGRRSRSYASVLR